MASLRSCGTKPCSQHLVKRSWRQTVTLSPPYWYTSAGIPSIPGDFPGFIWWTALFTSSSIGRSSSSVFTSAWGILSKEDSSTLCLSLKRLLKWLLKCSDQRSMMASLSVRRVEPSAERRGAWIWCEGPCTALRASKNERVSPRSAYICIFFARSVHQSFFITRSLFCRVLQAVLYAAFKLLLSGFVKRRWWLERFISSNSWIPVSDSSNQSLCFLNEKPATSAVVSWRTYFSCVQCWSMSVSGSATLSSLSASLAW